MTTNSTAIAVLETARPVYEHIAFAPEWRVCFAVDIAQVGAVADTRSAQERELLERLFAKSPVYKTAAEAGEVAQRYADGLNCRHLPPCDTGEPYPYQVVALKSVVAFSEPLSEDDF